MIIDGKGMERHPVEAGVLPGSPVPLIVFAIYTLGLIKYFEGYVSEAEELSIVDDFSRVATCSDVNHVVTILA